MPENMDEFPDATSIAASPELGGLSFAPAVPLEVDVATPAKRWLSGNKYRLTLIFGVSALLVIIVAASAINHFIGRIAESHIIRASEERLSANLVPILNSIENQSGEPLSLASVVDFAGLPMRLPTLAADYDLVELRVFDPEGQVVWSTQRVAPEANAPVASQFEDALDGDTSSRLLTKHELADLNGIRPSLSVVDTYVPLRNGSTGEVFGVLGIQRAVTEEMRSQIESTRGSVLRVTGAVMGGLFLALLAIVVVADLAISRSKRREQQVLRAQLVERHQAAQALLNSNQQLESVVQKLKDTQQQILQQERLRALGQMASGITHDFNNALTPILGFSSMLATHPELLDDRETLQSQLQFINIAAEDAAAVVSRLKEFYRKREDVEEFSSVNLSEITSLAVSLTQAKWKSQAQARGININLETSFAEVPNVLGNAPELREALINLVINAVDAMPEGGTLRVGTRREADHVTMTVGDTGMGMSDDVRSRCLDPFFTTKGTHGTGMGLAMVYGIMERHDGTMEIETELGKGTTFIMKLPVPQEALVEKETKAEPVGPGCCLNILVVDDEPLIRRLVADFLRMDGHAVDTAESGTEAVQMYSPGKFDLVLTDRAMPDMSGDQLALAIKGQSPGTPVILLTGFGDIMAATNDKPEGVDLILGKPLTQQDLQKAIEQVTSRPDTVGDSDRDAAPDSVASMVPV